MTRLLSARGTHRGFRSLRSPTPPESNPGVPPASSCSLQDLVSTKYSIVLERTGLPTARTARPEPPSEGKGTSVRATARGLT